ncbi:MAG: tetratricopeptide repeat protein [Candidatus Omnitrophica bacterium]|nr:tetratricopeptide repeat protein [Candidatus Omnitrophota bacterium]
MNAVSLIVAAVMFVTAFGAQRPVGATSADPAPPAPSPEQAATSRRTTAWQQGQQALQSGALHEAVLAFQEVLALSPNDPDTMNNLGVCYARLRQQEEAIELFKKALALNPKHAQARRNLARLSEEDGRFDEAIHLLQPASGTGADAGLWQDLGYLYYRSGDRAKATESFERAVKLARTPELLYDLACLYLLTERHREAVELLHEAIGMDGQRAAAHDALGQADERLGAIPQAKEAYATAHQLEPANPRFLRRLVRAAILDNDVASARPLVNELLRLDPAGAETQQYEAVMLLHEGAYDRAAIALERIVAQAPENAAAWNNLAIAYRHLGYHERSAQALDKAASLNKHSPAIQTNLGVEAAQTKDWEQARAALSAAVQLQPEFGPAVRNLELLNSVAPASTTRQDSDAH